MKCQILKLFEQLVSLGEGWNDQKWWLYKDKTKMYYDMDYYDEENGKGIWTLIGEFGTIVYIEYNIPNGFSNTIEYNKDNYKQVLNWVENAVKNKYIPIDMII